MSDNAQQPPNQANSYVDDYDPPTSTASTKPSDTKPSTKPASSSATPNQTSAGDAAQTNANDSEALESQNIFELLGVTDGTDQEKEAFLDELQLVIWDDFIENDVQLLLTEEEMKKLKLLMENKGSSNEAMQEELVEYLEKLIPDLEEIMLEKALELKEDMVRERIAGMREYYQGNQTALDAVGEAEKLVDQNQWKSASDKLNSIA